jgi:beta-lactamase superfamily II metal-dependent hydrolase
MRLGRKSESSSEILSRAISKALGLEVAPPTSAQNNSGIVLELAYQNSPYALFTADVGADVLKEITKAKTYQLLKVPHQGNKTG